MIVLDASVAIEVLLRSPKGLEVRRRVTLEGKSLHAPHLIDLEVAHVLSRLERIGDLSVRRSGGVLADLADLRIYRYPHDLFLRRIWKLRKNLSAYDAAYVALAETLEATLLTLDRRLANAPGHRAVVEVL